MEPEHSIPLTKPLLKGCRRVVYFLWTNAYYTPILLDPSKNTQQTTIRINQYSLQSRSASNLVPTNPCQEQKYPLPSKNLNNLHGLQALWGRDCTCHGDLDRWFPLKLIGETIAAPSTIWVQRKWK